MNSLMNVIREMNVVKETVDLDESTKEYAASLEKMASDKKLKNISKKDRDILAKIADMMKNANEEIDLDEDALNEAIDALDENVGKKVYEKKVGKSRVQVFKYSNGAMFAFFTSKGFGETNVSIKKLDKKVIDAAVKHFDDNKGLLGSSMDSIYEELESIQEHNVFGHSSNHGISDSLLAAVNRVVVGQDETLEPELETQNEIIENGAADLAEARTVRGKDGKQYKIDLDMSGKSVALKVTNQFGDFKTVTMKQAAKLFEQDVLEALDPVGKADKDIDNDGDVDDSDEYLHKRRKAISKALAKKESAEKKGSDEKKKTSDIEVNPKLEEGKMTPEQEEKREEIVLKLKEKEDEFKEKYGDRWEEVMYATATKLAMKK